MISNSLLLPAVFLFVAVTNNFNLVCCHCLRYLLKSANITSSYERTSQEQFVHCLISHCAVKYLGSCIDIPSLAMQQRTNFLSELLSIRKHCTCYVDVEQPFLSHFHCFCSVFPVSQNISST